MADACDVNLNGLVVFVAVVETSSACKDHGEQTHVASRSGSQREPADPEHATAHRNGGRQALCEASATTLGVAEDGLAAIAGDVGPLRGTLKVSAPIDFSSLFVRPALVELRREHPALEVELQCSHRFVDLVGEGIDVAIRLRRLANSNYRAVKIGKFVSWLVASPAGVDAWSLAHRAVDGGYDALHCFVESAATYLAGAGVPRRQQTDRALR